MSRCAPTTWCWNERERHAEGLHAVILLEHLAVPEGRMRNGTRKLTDLAWQCTVRLAASAGVSVADPMRWSDEDARALATALPPRPSIPAPRASVVEAPHDQTRASNWRRCQQYLEQLEALAMSPTARDAAFQVARVAGARLRTGRWLDVVEA